MTSAPTCARPRTNSRWFRGKLGSTKITRIPVMLGGALAEPGAPRYGPGMVAAAFVAPYLLEATARFVRSAAALPGVQLGVVTSEPLDRIHPELRDRLAGHWQVDNALDPGQVAEAVKGLAGQMGRVDRLVGALEQLQVPLAQVREWLGIEGMDVATATNVRDKPRMKEVLRAAGVPCARHRLVHAAAEAWSFADEVGFPLVTKPPAGAGSQATYRLDDRGALEGWLAAMPPRPD